MDTVASLWWLFLLMTVVGYVGAVLCQLKNMRDLMNNKSPSLMVPTFLLGLFGSGSFLALLLSVVVNLIKYAK